MLNQEQDGYEFCQKQMTECDRRLEQYLQQSEDRSQGAGLPEEKRKGRLKKKGNKPQFDLRAELFRMIGTDLTRIDGIDVMTAMTILSEAGFPLEEFHGDKVLAVFLADIVNCADVRVVQGGGGARLPLKALQRLRIPCQFFGHKLQGDESPQTGVLRFVQHARATAAELLDDAVMRDGVAKS